jgi:hypothetical protein
MATTKDQPMKEETSQVKRGTKEETKMEGLEGGIMPRGYLWKDFDDWYKSIFEDYSKIDQEMDRRFREFSDMMFKNQERQIEQFKKEMERQQQQWKKLEQEGGQKKAIGGAEG